MAEVFPAQSISGWIIIHQCNPISNISFNRTWSEYRDGFGNVSLNYWFGNEKIHQLTTASTWKLRVEVQSYDTRKWYSAEFDTFRVADEANLYKLNVAGYLGDGGDAFNVVPDPNWITNGMNFSTYDNDNDRNSVNCALTNGGWWLNICGTSNLAPVPGGYGRWGTLKSMSLAQSFNLYSSRTMIRPNQ